MRNPRTLVPIAVIRVSLCANARNLKDFPMPDPELRFYEGPS